MKSLISIFFKILLMIGVCLASSVAVQAQEIGGTPSAEGLQEGTSYTVHLPVILSVAIPPRVDAVGPAGGTMPALALNPAEPGILYVGTWGAGVYKTVNGGASWAAVNAGLGNTYIQSLAIHPTNPQVVYAGTYSGGVYKSVDGGVTWQASSGSQLSSHIIYDLEIDPQQPSTLFAATRINGSLMGYIFKSVDGGATWEEKFRGNRWGSILDYVYDVEVDPTNSNEVYITNHEHGFWGSIDGGNTWASMNRGVDDLSARTLVIPNGWPMYGGVWHGDGVYKSEDSGYLWVRTNNGMPEDVEVYRLTVDPSNASTLYACTWENGVIKTVNAAEFWFQSGLNGYFVYDLDVDTTNSQVLYASTGGAGLYRSENGGTGWYKSDAGIFNSNVTGVASLPSQPQAVFVAVNGSGVFRTLNRGASWQAVNTGLGDLRINRLVSQGGRLYALATSGTYASDDGANWSLFSGPQTLGQSVVDLVGALREWSSLPDELMLDMLSSQPGMVEGVNPDLANTPLISTAQSGTTLYGGTAGKGAWAYTSWWSLLGLDGRKVYSLAVDPILSRLLASSCSSDAYGYDTDCNVQYYSSGSWVNINDGLTGLKVNEIVVRADDYLAATTAGIYIRDNQGATWTRVGLPGVNVLALQVDADNAQMVYAATVGGAYVSADRGLTWSQAHSSLTGWTFQSIQVDPLDHDIIYFGTKESGTYRWNRSP